MPEFEKIEEYKKARKEIYELVKNVPELTNKQLDKQFSQLKGLQVPVTERKWKMEAIVRLLQHKYYTDHGLEIPEVIKHNFDIFFKSSVPKNKPRKTPKKKTVVERGVLNDERVRLLRLITNKCTELIPNGNSKFHPQYKYGTVKSGKSVVMFIEKKLRKIIVFMGGERERRNHPKLEISIGIDDESIKPAIQEFIRKHLSKYSHRRDKRWQKCEEVLDTIVKAFKNNLENFNDYHAHPTGRYTTFKRGRLVLVFITQDRAKGEIAFHPGGERENNPDITTTIKVYKVNDPSEIEKIVKEFINTHYTEYMKEKDKSKSSHNKEMKKILDICKKAIDHDEIFHHPKDFFGLIKNAGRPIAMIKRSKNKGCYDIVAWVKKQKNNPSVTVNLSDQETEIQKKVANLIDKYIK